MNPAYEAKIRELASRSGEHSARAFSRSHEVWTGHGTRDLRKCTAHNRYGELCRKFAMTGQDVCRVHSGASPRAKTGVAGDAFVGAERCAATNKINGKRCQRWSMIGQRFCVLHSGAFPTKNPQDAALQFLTDYLSYGPAKESDVKLAAKAAGISRSTLRRARERIVETMMWRLKSDIPTDDDLRSSTTKKNNPYVTLEVFLRDVKSVWPDDIAFLPTADLLRRLNELDGRPWPTWVRGNKMTARALAYILVNFGIKPRHRSDGKVRGYLLYEFQDAFIRHIEETT